MKPESPTVCWAITDLESELQYWIYGKARGAHFRAPVHWGPSCNKLRMLLIFSSTQRMS